MLIFISGTDSFMASRAINKVKEKYKEKNPDSTELIELSYDSETNWADLLAVPLFATSRLVIIRSIGFLPISEQENLIYFLNNLPETTILVLWDNKELQSKSALADTVTKIARQKIQVNPISGKDLQEWIIKRGKELGLSVKSDIVKGIVGACGSDLWAVENELIFLSNSNNGNLSSRSKRDEVEKFASFRLIRAKEWAKLAKHVSAELESGMPFEMILGGIASAVRQNVAEQVLKRDLVNLLIDIDVGLKTGLLDEIAAAALLVFHLPKPSQKRVQWEIIWEETTF